MSGYGPPRGWRGSNAWSTASPQRTEEPMSETKPEVAEPETEHGKTQTIPEDLRELVMQSSAENGRLYHRANQLQHELDVATARAERAEAALARLRAQLGESGIEWGVQHPLYGTDYIQGADNARVQCYQLNVDETGQPWRVVTRLTGQWRGENEPDATRLERYDDATPRTALERAAGEQGEREGGGA